MTKVTAIAEINQGLAVIKQIVTVARVKGLPAEIPLNKVHANYKTILRAHRVLLNLIPKFNAARRVRDLVSEQVWAQYMFLDCHDLREVKMWETASSELRSSVRQSGIRKLLQNLTKTTKEVKNAEHQDHKEHQVQESVEQGCTDSNIATETESSVN